VGGWRTIDLMTAARDPSIAAIPRGLTAIGAATAAFVPALPVAELAPGQMRRVTYGDLDVLLANTATGIVAIDDRCPHMSAPLSLGKLDGCLVDCPLHSGQFDLATGNATRMPTTGGIDADGTYHPVWAPPDREPKPDPPGIKAEARRFTRVRRIRYYPVRIVGGTIEVAVPRA
jgi:nitrite reductase/ring-hydroxylating ferredoxin subunit